MHRKDFIEKLDHAKPFLMNSDFIPILTHFCFDTKSIIAYNDVAGIKLSMESELDCAIPGSLLLKMLGTMTSETIKIEMPSKHQLQLLSGQTKIKLPILLHDEFVFDIPNLESTTSFDIPVSFLKGIEKCLISVSKDQSHPETTGITWIIDTSGIRLYSTDNKTMSKYSLVSDEPYYSDEYVFIVPAFFCEQLLDLADAYLNPEDSFKLHVSDKFVVAELGENGLCYIFTRLIAAEQIIDYEKAIHRFFSSNSEVSLVNIPTELPAALERATLLTQSASFDAKTSNVKVTDDLCTILTESNYGNAKDIIELGYNAGNFSFEINPELIQRGLKVTNRIAVLEKVLLLSNDTFNFLHLVSHSNTGTQS